MRPGRTGHTAPRRRARRAPPAGRRAGAIAFNTAAMIDIVFLLLIYFLLIADFRDDEASLRLDAPAGDDAAAPADPFDLREPPITILVANDGPDADACRLAIDSPLLSGAASIDDLHAGAAALLGDLLTADQAFVIVAAPDVRWEHALGVLNALRLAGYDRVRMEAS